MKSFISASVFLFLLMSCNQKKITERTSIKKVDMVWLDAIIKNSDSTYSRPYKRNDFVTAYYYTNTKLHTVCQVMKDAASIIRQIIISKNDVRIHYSQYYANGQLVAALPLDEYGQFNGNADCYYLNGEKQSEGAYQHGFKLGKWKNFTEQGKLSSEDEYDSNGQVIKTINHLDD